MEFETSRSVLGMKKFLILSGLFLGLGTLIYFTLFPFGDLDHLKNGYYVSTTVLPDLKASYTFVKKRPVDWVDIKNISKNLQRAIILSEDWTFYHHEGLDPEEIRRAINDSLETGKKPRGASTISQQLVKNLFLSHDRSYLRKILEVFITLKMEEVLTKDRILELYLNVIEYGPGMYGIKKAAWTYFKKSPGALTPRESAFIAMLLPSPKRYSDSFRKKKLSKFTRAMIRNSLNKMVKAGNLTPEQKEVQWATPFFWETDTSYLGEAQSNDLTIPDSEELHLTEESLQNIKRPVQKEEVPEETAPEETPDEEKSPEPSAVPELESVPSVPAEPVSL